MSHHKRRVPSYCLHKRSGRAVVRLNGKDHYLGQYGSDESHAEYQRLIQQWLLTNKETAARRTERSRLANPMVTVSEVMYEYREFAKDYYVKNGEPTQEFTEMGIALRPVRLLFGEIAACDFGPLKLKIVRNHMIDVMDLSRGVINNRVNRIKRFFRWAVAEELVPPSVIHGLEAVQGLRKGRTKARETDPVKPVDDEHVEAVLAFVSIQVATMIQLQRMTGMRPGEVTMVRASNIDMRGDTWIYSPSEHKNEYRGHERKIPFGPKAQELLKPFLKTKTAGAFLFSPRDAEEHRNELRRANRKSPMTPSQRQRKAKKKPKRAKRGRYDTASYRRAIKYGIKQVNRIRKEDKMEPIPSWFPLQLRHSRATELNELYGIEAAAVSLGHAHADVTKVYAERNLKLAVDVAMKTG